MEDLMIDIETMGTSSYAAIISIAAVQFDISTGTIGEIFYKGIDLKSCVDSGLKIEPGSVEWWLGQNEEARLKYLQSQKVSLNTALNSLSQFIGILFPAGANVWGNSARFDLGLLSNAYSSERLELPWDYRKERCVRTLVSLKPEVKDNHIYIGTAHDPVDDCRNQIAYCSKTWKIINHV